MTSYVDANSNVIKSYVESRKTEKKKGHYQTKIIDFQEIIITRVRAQTYLLLAAGCIRATLIFNQ